MRIHKRKKGSQHGIALVVAMLTLLVITAIALGMLAMSNSETLISSNFRDEQIAFSAARGGIEEVRDRLRPGATNSLTASLPTALPGANGGIVYVTNPAAGEVVQPWTTTDKFTDDEICKEVICDNGVPTGDPWYSTTSASASYAANPVMDWKWVRITVKTNSTGFSVNGANNGNRVCWNGSNEVTVAPAFTCQQVNPSYRQVYALTALAMTPSGARRMITDEVTTSAPPAPPGPLVFDGANPTYNAPDSNVFNINGNDANKGPNNGAGCGTANNEPALGAYGGTAVTTLQNNGIVQKRAGAYTGSTGTTPSVTDISSQLGPLGTVDGLTQLVNSLTASADPANIYTGTASSPVTAITNPGTPSAPVINIVNGDLTPSTVLSGTGILVVTGTLTMSGNPNWNGIIYVIGKGVLIKNGAGNGTMNGSILVADLYDSSNKLIPLGANNPPGAPSITWNGGGNGTIQYDTCWINYLNQALPYRELAQRELLL